MENSVQPTNKNTLLTILKEYNEVFSNRLEVCNECPKFIKSTTLCTECYCFINTKAKKTHEKCPLGKW
jgi:hypothetical protein